jgi:hypothetical protein
MNDDARRALCAIVAVHGRTVCDDPDRLSGLLA